ncbi:MAG: hypothetical protein AAF242_13855 [Bacteroidota bacterium]
MYNRFLNYYLLWICLLVIPTLASGQQLEGAQMDIDLTSTALQIDIAYRLTAGESMTQLKLKGIGPDWTQISNLQVQVQGKTYELMIEEEANLVQDLLVSLDTPLAINQVASCIISYQMRRLQAKNQRTTYTIPVIYVDGEAAAADKDVFQARLIPEAGQTIQSIFPAMSWKKDANGQYTFGMQVLPAWIKFNVYDGPAPFFTLERKVDFGVLLVLIGLLIFGAQRLKQHQS